MRDLIVISGAPGSGKSTVIPLLQKELLSPYIDFGWLRERHLLPDWSNQTPEEEEMAFENLVFILKNYLAHGYKNILVDDLKYGRVGTLVEIFSENNFLVVSLVLDDEELKRRIKERNSGFTNIEVALAWNKTLKEGPHYKNEFKIDNTANDPQKTAEKILDLIKIVPNA